jgi:hypothetical protein
MPSYSPLRARVFGLAQAAHNPGRHARVKGIVTGQRKLLAAAASGHIVERNSACWVYIVWLREHRSAARVPHPPELWMKETNMKIILAALGLLATATIVSAAEGPGNSAETPGHEMQEHSSVPGSPGASGFAPGHEMKAEHEGKQAQEEEDEDKAGSHEEEEHEGTGTHEEEDQGAEHAESDHEGAGLDVHIGKEPSHEEEEHEEEH